MRFLIRYGCDQAQGNLFARPMDSAAFGSALAKPDDFAFLKALIDDKQARGLPDRTSSGSYFLP